jgi:aspartyl protease family protein
MKIRALHCALALASPIVANATDVTVIGLFPGKAVVTINRGAPHTLSVGDKPVDGVVLVSTDRGTASAILEIDGKREKVEMGQHFETAEQTGARNTVALSQDASGHFITDGMVNGAHVRFLVDTGATLVAIPISEAARLGIDYQKGQAGYSVMADGRRVASYRVVLDSVTIGDLTLLNVEGSLHQGGGIPLLGMSFLNRTEMRREGQNLTLTKRY